MTALEQNELPASVGVVDVGAPVRRPTRYRWAICALLFFAATINYMDRQVLGILAPTLEEEIGWSEAEYGGIVMAFQAAYAVALLIFGHIIDRIGTKWGWSVNGGRKAAMLFCALCVTPLMLGWLVDTMWLAVALVSLAAAAHQGWSANIFTTASDMFPRRAVASVVGIGGMLGSVGGMLFAAAAGLWLEASGSNYVSLFFVCGLAYVFALGVIHLLVPRLEPAPVDR